MITDSLGAWKSANLRCFWELTITLVCFVYLYNFRQISRFLKKSNEQRIGGPSSTDVVSSEETIQNKGFSPQDLGDSTVPQLKQSGRQLSLNTSRWDVWRCLFLQILVGKKHLGAGIQLFPHTLKCSCYLIMWGFRKTVKGTWA